MPGTMPDGSKCNTLLLSSRTKGRYGSLHLWIKCVGVYNRETCTILINT